MEVQFTPEQEARILQEDEQFQADIGEAIEQADSGQLIDHEEVKARIARSLQSR